MDRGDLAEKRHATVVVRGLLTPGLFGGKVIAQNLRPRQKGLRSAIRTGMANKKIAIANNFKSSFIFLFQAAHLLYARGHGRVTLQLVPTRALALQTFLLISRHSGTKFPREPVGAFAYPNVGDDGLVTAAYMPTSKAMFRSWDDFSHFRATCAVFGTTV